MFNHKRLFSALYWKSNHTSLKTLHVLPLIIFLERNWKTLLTYIFIYFRLILIVFRHTGFEPLFCNTHSYTLGHTSYQIASTCKNVYILMQYIFIITQSPCKALHRIYRKNYGFKTDIKFDSDFFYNAPELKADE